MSVPSQQDDFRYFSRHLFRTGLECPTRLWYRARNYPENRESIPFIEHYRFNKKQLTRLCRRQFPKGVEIEASTMEGVAQRTSEALKKRKSILFGPLFIHGRLLASVPIAEKKGNTLRIYHIQTKAFNPSKHRISSTDGRIYAKWKDNLVDIAFQCRVVERCHPNLEVVPILVLPDKKARADSGNLYNPEADAESNSGQLLAFVDVSEEVQLIYRGEAFEEEPFEGHDFDWALTFLEERYYEGKKYPPEIGNKCKNCEFRIEPERAYLEGERSGFAECWDEALGKNLQQQKRPLVFDLIGPGTRNWIEREVYFQEDVVDDEIASLEQLIRSEGHMSERQRQSLQVMQAKGREVPAEIIRPRLFEELERWEYPIHFVDFEAGNYVLPLRENRRPYHLLVFQFSCHSLQRDGSWTHHQWIDGMDESYPNYEMVRRLREVPAIGEGTIVQYSDFERHALKTIRKELKREREIIGDAEELAGWIEGIIRRNDSGHPQGPYLADLSRIVKDFYYNHRMEDSLSIKDVLQSVLSVSDRLKEIYRQPYRSSNFDEIIWWQQGREEGARSPYMLLQEHKKAGGVRRGTEAMVTYAKLLTGEWSPEQKEAFRSDLLSYCELDTLAMMMIYQHWKHLMHEKRN